MLRAQARRSYYHAHRDEGGARRVYAFDATVVFMRCFDTHIRHAFPAYMSIGDAAMIRFIAAFSPLFFASGVSLIAMITRFTLFACFH